MDEFERNDDLNETKDIENAELTSELDDTAVDETVELEDFGAITPGEEFLLSDEPEEKKSGVPIVGIIAIASAVIIALVCFFVVRHNKNKTAAEAVPTSSVEETVTAEIRDGKLFINDQEVDPEDVGIDPEDENKLEEYVSSVNKGDVTVADKVAEKYSIAPSKPSGSVATSAKTSGTSAQEDTGNIVKPSYLYITGPVAKEFEVGYNGTISYVFGPVYTSNSQRGVTITSSDPSVIEVDHLGRFTTKSLGSATITVQSKVTPKAKASITLKVVDHTTTVKVVVPTVTTTTQPSVTTTTTTKPTTSPTQEHNGPVAISDMSIQGSSGIDGTASRSISVGGSTVIGINFTPSNANKSDVTFSSSNPSVCTVNADGRVTGISKGTATIVISPKAGSASNLMVKITVD